MKAKQFLLSACNYRNFSVINQFGYYNDNFNFVDVNINTVDPNTVCVVKVSDCNGFLFEIKARLCFILKSAMNNPSSGLVYPIFEQR